MTCAKTQSNNLLVNSYRKRTISVVATCVESSLNVIGDNFVEIVGLNLVNEGVGIHISQPKILAIHGEHVVVMEFEHDNLTQI